MASRGRGGLFFTWISPRRYQVPTVYDLAKEGGGKWRNGRMLERERDQERERGTKKQSQESGRGGTLCVSFVAGFRLQ